MPMEILCHKKDYHSEFIDANFISKTANQLFFFTQTFISNSKLNCS